MPSFNKGELVAERYEILGALGRGGMGMVYIVRDQETGEQIALKTLLPEYVRNTRALQRFLQEVNAVRKLDHPCIVKVFDAQQTGDLIFYTMEFVEGKTLRTWMGQGKRFGMGSTVRVLSMLSHALEHAHRYTIHRDISPENIMLTPKGDVKLLDFGLAKLTDAASSFTRVGVSLGKIQYSAPEQRADAKNVDHRADLYSLGVLFYEMMCRALPEPGKPLTSIVPGLPQEIDTFVEKAMAADPEQRFQSAKEFREALWRVYQLSKMDRAEAAAETKAATKTPTPGLLARMFARIVPPFRRKR
ncbi:MAG: serine/threonine-protein kinase [Candidatus Hydrogenedentota bacterium]